MYEKTHKAIIDNLYSKLVAMTQDRDYWYEVATDLVNANYEQDARLVNKAITKYEKGEKNEQIQQ